MAKGNKQSPQRKGKGSPQSKKNPSPQLTPTPSPTSALRVCTGGDIDERHLPTVSSQAQCRFNGNHLKFSEFSVEYNGQPELFHTQGCTLECGVVYAIVGPNGVGKSSFGKLIASKMFPGFPENLSTCFIDACGSKKWSNSPPREYLRGEVDARCEQLRDQIRELESELEQVDGNDDSIEAITTRLGGLYEQEDELETSSKVEIDNILNQLGFESANLLTTPVGNLSAGWRYKCELASALLSHAELLVIDEPSFLDKSSMSWFTQQVKKIASGGAIVCLISHKEQLLEDLADRILFISASRELETYNCGYEHFKSSRGNVTAHATKEVSNWEAEKAASTTSLKKVQQQLAKSEKTNHKRIAVNHEDRRFIQGKSVEAKQNADRSLAAKVKQLKKETERLEELAVSSREHETCPIPMSGSGWAHDQQMISTQNMDFAYRPDHPLLNDVSIAVYGGDRIALTGPNGEGKSTLLALLLGQLTPTAGTVCLSGGARVAYFPQDALEKLVAEHGDLTATELVQQRCDTPAVKARVYLGKYGLKGNLAMQPIRTLSAGQRTRLYFALEFLPETAPSLLILDEMENLDKDTTAELLSSLSHFDGAIICVSHDEVHTQHFNPRQIWRVNGGSVAVELTDTFS
eukprot:GFYU01003579.1.p1 GENE.GFYU01003579.1~~GFYU01003579.1.p1  ORF type:complete len:634 (+),score=134.46 GFYU01003579.1:198-2099(+)